MQLIHFVDTLVQKFRPVFRRQATFAWFVIVFWALMLRLDMAGVTSIIRCMGLHPSEYVNLLNFFHSSAFSVATLCAVWRDIVFSTINPVRLNGLPLYIVDGIKVGKAGRKMPGVKLLHQESEDNNKPEYMMGHYWGAIGVLFGTVRHVFSLPLRFQIQDGIKQSPAESHTLVTKMANLVVQSLCTKGFVVGDAYFTTAAFLAILVDNGFHYIGKIKSSTVGYHLPPPPPKKRGRGRPKKYGTKVKLKHLFKNRQLFTKAAIPMYGEVQVVCYYAIDLLWKGRLVRFVLTKLSNGSHGILLCTDISLLPEDIIRAYAFREKIEASFKALVHCLCAFGYHFWLMAMTKIKRGSGNQFLHRATVIYKKQVAKKIEAYERFVNIMAIALGTLQILSIKFHDLIWTRFPLWLRTLPAHGFPSEHVTRLTLQNELHQNFLNNNNSVLLHEILSQKRMRHSSGHPVQIATLE